MPTEPQKERDLIVARVLRAGKKPLRRCYTMHHCFYCGETIRLGQNYRDGGYNNHIHEDCYAKACDELLKDYVNAD